MNVIVAWGDGNIDYHRSNYKTYSHSFVQLSSAEIPTSESSFFSLHGWFLFIFWTIFAFVGFVFIRYFKYRNFAVIIHVVLMSSVVLITFIFVLLQSKKFFKRQYHQIIYIKYNLK